MENYECVRDDRRGRNLLLISLFLHLLFLANITLLSNYNQQINHNQWKANGISLKIN